MAYVLLRSVSTFIDPYYEIDQWRYNDVSHLVETRTIYNTTAINSNLTVGDFVDSYCQDSAEHTITYAGFNANPQLMITDTVTDPSGNCCADFLVSDNNGTADGTNPGTKKLIVTFVGNDPAFEINVNAGGYVPISNPGTNQHIIDNIPSGTTVYQYFARDAKGCVRAETAIVNNNGQCDNIDMSVVGTNASFGLNDGEINASAFGGTDPYEYSINGGALQVSGTFSGLGPGTYTILGQDDNGCQVQKQVTITQAAANPGGMFDPDIRISPAIPYRFALIKADPNENVYDNVLFNGSTKYNTSTGIHCQMLDYSGILTIQIYYVDSEFASVPRVKIRDYYTNIDLGDVSMLNVATGYYQISVNTNTIPGIQDKIIYFQIYSTIGGVDQFAHAQSEPIRVRTFDRSMVVEIRYNNSSDIIIKHGIDKPVEYETSGYDNYMYLPVMQFWQSDINTDQVLEDIGEGVDQKLYEQNKDTVKLTTRELPAYMHKKIKIISSHDNIRIDNGESINNYVFTDNIDSGEYQFKSRKRRATYNLIDQEFNNENIIT